MLIDSSSQKPPPSRRPGTIGLQHALYVIIAIVLLVDVCGARDPAPHRGGGDDSSTKELRLMKNTLGGKEYLRLLADRILDKARYREVRRQVMAFNGRQLRGRKEMKRSERTAHISSAGDDDERAGDDDLFTTRGTAATVYSVTTRRNNLHRLYDYLEQLKNHSRGHSRTTTDTPSGSPKSVTPSHTSSDVPSHTVYVLPLGVYDTIEVLRHVFTVNFATYMPFDQFDEQQFATDLFQAMASALDVLRLPSEVSMRAMISNMIAPEAPATTVANETLAVMKCLVSDASMLSSLQPLNFSLCHDDESGPKCVAENGLMPNTINSSCKVANVAGCACPTSLAYFPPSSTIPLWKVISLPNESSSGSPLNSGNESGTSTGGAPAAKSVQEEMLESTVSLLQQLRRLLSPLAKGGGDTQNAQIENNRRRRAHHKLDVSSLTLQVQLVFLLQYATSFNPQNVSEIADFYDDLRNVTEAAFTNDTLLTNYLIRGKPIITLLPIVEPATSAPMTSAPTPPVPQPTSTTAITNPPPTTGVPRTNAPTIFIAVETSGSSTGSAAYGFLALLIFPAALLGYAMYRLYEYCMWKRYTSDFSVKQKTRDDDDGGEGNSMSGSGPVDVEVERSIGNATWIGNRNKKDEADESRKWIEMTSSSFDPIQKNQQELLSQSAHAAVATTTAAPAALEEQEDAEADKPDEDRGEVSPRKPISTEEHLRANAAVLAKIQVAGVSPQQQPPQPSQLQPQKSTLSAFSLLAAKKNSVAVVAETGAVKPQANNPLDEFAAVLVAGDASSRAAAAAATSKPPAAEDEYSDEEGEDDDADLR